MKQKLKIMKSDAKTFLINNLDDEKIIKLYNNKNIDFEKEINKIAKMECFIEVNIWVDFPKLIVANKKSGNIDVENAKCLYAALNEINDSFATDARLWSGISHLIYRKYIIENIGREITKEDVLKYFLFSKINGDNIHDYNFREYAMANNTIPRLWYIGRTFIREDSTTPFKYLNFISRDLSGFTSRLLTIKIFRNQNILDSLLDAMIDIEKETGKKISRTIYNEIVKFLVCLSGIYSLDLADRDFIYNKCKKKGLKLIKQNVEKKELSKEYQIMINTFNNFDKIIEVKEFNEEMSKYSNGNIIKKIVEKELSKDSDFLQKIEYNGFEYILLNDNFATKEYLENKYKFYANAISCFSGNDKIMYNIVSIINHKTFTYNQIKTYEHQFKLVYGNDFNIDNVFQDGISTLIKLNIISKKDDTYHINDMCCEIK